MYIMEEPGKMSKELQSPHKVVGTDLKNNL